MTLFIQKENIKIIWDVISMCPMFHKLFTTSRDLPSAGCLVKLTIGPIDRQNKPKNSRQ
jgi:hypothetical protein